MKTLPAALFFRRLNELGGKGYPFAFIIDSMAEKGIIIESFDNESNILWQTPMQSNFVYQGNLPLLKKWNSFPVPYKTYKTGFKTVQHFIKAGETFLVNFTQPSLIKTNLNLEELFYLSRSKYKIYLKGNFTCFSPETFVRIENGIISSYPMKGTIEYNSPDSADIILADPKESAEHNTIVDLIRNDLSRVADKVRVENFRFPERIQTNRKELIQVSSEIKGELSKDWPSQMGSILSELLPAGSVTGAPKPRTLEIIRKVENYDRGWYTGIFGVFDGKTLDSAVLIRFIEKIDGQLIFKSGGGITFLSDCKAEYNEMMKKIYVPLN